MAGVDQLADFESERVILKKGNRLLIAIDEVKPVALGPDPKRIFELEFRKL